MWEFTITVLMNLGSQCLLCTLCCEFNTPGDWFIVMYSIIYVIGKCTQVLNCPSPQIPALQNIIYNLWNILQSFWNIFRYCLRLHRLILLHEVIPDGRQHLHQFRWCIASEMNEPTRKYLRFVCGFSDNFGALRELKGNVIFKTCFQCHLFFDKSGFTFARHTWLSRSWVSSPVVSDNTESDSRTSLGCPRRSPPPKKKSKITVTPQNRSWGVSVRWPETWRWPPVVWNEFLLQSHGDFPVRWPVVFLSEIILTFFAYTG
jgi:hypothetical protein